MKYCSKCGKELFDEAIVCPGCGCPVEGASVEAPKTQSPETKKTLRTVAKVFMLLSTIGAGLALIATPILFFFFKDVFRLLLQYRINLGTGIAVCWCIPMTVHYFKCCEDNRQPSTGFKVCTLLFVNLIAGICMLIDRDE